MDLMVKRRSNQNIVFDIPSDICWFFLFFVFVFVVFVVLCGGVVLSVVIVVQI